jgi:capsular polysaccharide biosynthesis protein
LVLDTQDPKTRVEAQAIADTGEAIATSPTQVQAALGRIHVKRDPVEVAMHHVAVGSLGTSGVLLLSVRDRNRQVAEAMANSLAAEVIRARLEVSNGELRRILDNTVLQIGDLNRKISRASASRRVFLADQRAALEAQRTTLLSNAALRPTPSIISPATLPAHADSSAWLSDLSLGAILGLILGLGFAGLVELIRPTVAGEDAIARAFGTPVLGQLPGSPGEPSLLDSTSLSERIRLAGEVGGVHRIELLGAGPHVDLKPLATSLTLHREQASELAEPRDGSGEVDDLGSNGHSVLAAQKAAVGASAKRPGSKPGPHAATQVPAARRRSRRPGQPLDRRTRDIAVDVFDVHTRPSNGGGTGLVVVSPTALKKTSVDDVNRLLALSRLHILGLVTYEPDHSLRQRPFEGATLQAKNWSRRVRELPGLRR